MSNIIISKTLADISFLAICRKALYVECNIVFYIWRKSMKYLNEKYVLWIGINFLLFISFKSNLEIKNIHFNLIDELIVSHIEDDRQSVAAWNVAFRRIVNIPTRTNYSVRDDFNYLERRGLLGVGRYEVLKELFGKKKETLSAIQQASKKIGDILESIRMDRHLLGGYL